MSLSNDTFAAFVLTPNGLLNSHSIVQRHGITLWRSFVIFGGLRVYWYASVSMNLPGNAFSTASAIAFTKRTIVPAWLSSSASTAAQFVHSQYPRQSFWLTP